MGLPASQAILLDNARNQKVFDSVKARLKSDIDRYLASGRRIRQIEKTSDGFTVEVINRR